ncbi:hypothetical protein PPSIR1_11360 [Plesiocystis pacifica SIR-1]|uniref:Uncharacterized protein n=1 Tax=Plesiocystis pacifica SIR-1 TaxID=391625 RepID=A6G175_9BACT|nr:hypothetical protein [Plesiocystis pacifica]EDM80370.1 hypothetical protein PPSIR1_11360 [Plesiocystis pacifica SIR-1]
MARAADPVVSSSKGAEPGSGPIALCPFNGSGITGGCNTIVVYTDTLTTPEDWREYSNRSSVGMVRFRHSGAVVRPAQLLAHGAFMRESIDTRDLDAITVVESKAKPALDQIKQAQRDLEAVKYVVAVRPNKPASRTTQRLFDVDLFVYEVSSSALLASMHIEHTCTDVDYVYASGPHEGAYHSTADCLDQVVKNQIGAGLMTLFPGISLGAY